MECAYLGLFQRVFNWVLSRILDPVYRFVSSLLTTVLSWVFEKILAPVLMPILEAALEFFIDLWLELISTRLYMLFSGLLKLIDYLETAFDVFIGLRDVTYTEANGTVVTGSLVEVLLQQNTISTVFWMITLGALGLALILTIYGTARSAFDLDFENKRPVSKVLAAMMKTFIQFFMVPFLVYFMLRLSAIILKSVTSILSFGNTTSLGRIVFMIASLNAAKNDSFNINSETALDIEFGTSPADTVRYPFYSMAAEGGGAVKDYGNIKQVMDVFHLSQFDYLIGFIAAVFLLFTIGVCLIVFVQRIFELILLYLVSPYFVCMMPLDDGERFGRWREMFIGKCFTGFGSVIGMRLFLLICPMVMGNRIQFGSATSPEMDYMMKLFFLAGGAWAMYKSGSMITSLLSSQAGMSEANTAAMAGGMLYSHTVGMAMAKGSQFLSSGMSRIGSRGLGSAGAGAAAAGAKAGQEAGRFGGSRTGSPVMRDSRKPGLGTRMKNTMALGTITKRNLSAAKTSLKSGDFSGAASSGLRAFDGVGNLSRVARGKEAKAGVGERMRNRYNNTVDAARRGGSALSSSIDKTKQSVYRSTGSLQSVYTAVTGPGSFRDKAGSVADLGRNLYGLRKDAGQAWSDLGSASRGLRSAIHRVDAGGSMLSADFSGNVLAREFPGLKFTGSSERGAGTATAPAPGNGATGVHVNVSRGLGSLESNLGSLESAASSGGVSGMDSRSTVSGLGGGSSAAGLGSRSTVSGLGGGSSVSGYGSRSTVSVPGGSTAKAADPGRWSGNGISREQVRCTSIPAVQKVSAANSGNKVTYESLSVKGLKIDSEQGKGKITRRNSI